MQNLRRLQNTVAGRHPKGRSLVLVDHVDPPGCDEDHLEPNAMKVYVVRNVAAVGDLTRMDVNFLGLNASTARASLIRHARARDMKVYVWTINDPIQMVMMLGRGVDGIITDEPALAREVMELHDQLSPIARLLVWIAAEGGMLSVPDSSSTARDA